MFRFSLVVVAGLSIAGSAFAGWADSLFEEMSKDFGPVPRGPTLSHSFTVTNKTVSPIHISGVRVSCGCVSASALRHDLAPGQSTVIAAQMDTRRFSGAKAVTIYVTFDQPQYDEVRLLVQANGRDDVSISPETLNFGRVAQGNSGKAEATVSLFGFGSLRIQDARCDSNYVQLGIAEAARDGSQTAYRVTARLRPDLPVGNWYSDVWLTTDNPSLPRLRIH